MRVLNVVNVNDAYAWGTKLIHNEGELETSRAGDVYSLTEPLAVVYANPWERVLFDSWRDANPFFFLFEGLWLLAGRNDAKWLDRFVHDFSSRFAESDGHLHGSYGFRWRYHFDVEGGGNDSLPDQLDTVAELLSKNPKDRRVVIQMWDPVADLGRDRRDVPCNLTVVPRIIANKLNITVFNRSNDVIWGMFGANAVQFSMLLEYLAGRIGVRMGTYTQVSTNAHLYRAHEDKVVSSSLFMRGGYPEWVPMGQNWDVWDRDLQTFMEWADDWEQQPPTYPDNPWFENTAQPLFAAHAMWKQGERKAALELIQDPIFEIAPDWRKAAGQWMLRRIDKEKA